MAPAFCLQASLDSGQTRPTLPSLSSAGQGLQQELGLVTLPEEGLHLSPRQSSSYMLSVKSADH